MPDAMSDSSRPTATETPRRVEPATRARQGRYGRHMMWVLLGGIFLVVAAFAAIMAYRAGDFASVNANNGASPALVRQQSQGFQAPQPAPVTPQPGTDHTAPGPAPRSP